MEILKINPKNSQQVIEKTLEFLKKRKVVVFPTDTVYIPMADATNQNAVEKVFLIKKRLPTKPIPIFVKDIKMAKKIVKINRKQEKFLREVWPGRVSAVLKRRKSKIKLYGVDKKTIALRIPNYKLVNILLEKLNKPLIGTSANISGKPASGRLKEILQQFKSKEHQPDLVIDGGVLPGKPSKVIDFTVSPLKILRR